MRHSATDPQVLDAAYRKDRILVAANVADFEKLARARELHAGIVLVEDGDLLRDEQDALVRRAALAIEGEYRQGRDMVNRVMFIRRDNAVRFEEMPQDARLPSAEPCSCSDDCSGILPGLRRFPILS